MSEKLFAAPCYMSTCGKFFLEAIAALVSQPETASDHFPVKQTCKRLLVDLYVRR